MGSFRNLAVRSGGLDQRVQLYLLLSPLRCRAKPQPHVSEQECVGTTGTQLSHLSQHLRPCHKLNAC